MLIQRQRLHGRTGAAAIEMAIVTPVLITIAYGCTDFGRVFHAHTIVSNAARCGAEYGSLHNFTSATRPGWEAAVRDAATTEMQGLRDFQPSNLSVDVATTVDADGLFYVAVEVTYPFATVIAWGGLPSTVDLKHRVEMRRIH